MVATAPRTGYAPVNGLNMYYEIHGAGHPLLLLRLAQSRQVVAVELQAHGRTADIARPLRMELMAGDAAALLRHLEVEEADVFGYSLGAGVALQMAMRYPELVRKLAVASVSVNRDGLQPGVLDGIQAITPDVFVGSPWHDAYLRVAPNPDDFATLVEKIKQLNGAIQDLPREAVRAIPAPTLVIAGDADIVQPEHAVELFRLRGGGGPGDMAGLSPAQLAVLPGTTHVSLIERADWLAAMIAAFLDAPLPGAE